MFKVLLITLAHFQLRGWTMQSFPKSLPAGLIGAAALSLVIPQPVLAHGGGLAADGCHNDRKNGGRHCHRGGSGNSSAPRQPSRLLGSSGGGRSVYYPNCAAARSAGAAPVVRGEPGYASHLDRDNDGIGCE
jgi:hypothetical protein